MTSTDCDPVPDHLAATGPRAALNRSPTAVAENTREQIEQHELENALAIDALPDEPSADGELAARVATSRSTASHAMNDEELLHLLEGATIERGTREQLAISALFRAALAEVSAAQGLAPEQANDSAIVPIDGSTSGAHGWNGNAPDLRPIIADLAGIRSAVSQILAHAGQSNLPARVAAIEAASQNAVVPAVDLQPVVAAIQGASYTVASSIALAIEQNQAIIAEAAAAIRTALSRPAPAIDLEPLIAAVQHAEVGHREGARRSAAALQAIAEQVARTTHTAIGSDQAASPATAAAVIGPVPPSAPSVGVRARRARVAFGLHAVACVLLCWAAVLLARTGERTLAIGSAGIAGLIGCSRFVARRARRS